MTLVRIIIEEPVKGKRIFRVRHDLALFIFNGVTSIRERNLVHLVTLSSHVVDLETQMKSVRK